MTAALVTVAPTLAILVGALLLLVAILVVIVATSNKMSSNVERILAVLLGRDMPFRVSDPCATLPVLSPLPNWATHARRPRWQRVLRRSR